MISSEPAGHPAGDKAVDSVDNPGYESSPSANHGHEGPPHHPTEGEPATAGKPKVERPSEDGSGRDLAFAALQAAREASTQRRNQRTNRGFKGVSPRELRSRRRRWSGPGPDDRDPQPVGRVLERLTRERKWRAHLANGSVFGEWAQLVGAEVAEHAQPVALKNGELTVQADSTAWATQLRLLQGQLINKIAAGIGPGVVKRIKINGPTRPSWRHGPRHIAGRGPRDTYG